MNSDKRRTLVGLIVWKPIRAIEPCVSFTDNEFHFDGGRTWGEPWRLRSEEHGPRQLD